MTDAPILIRYFQPIDGIRVGVLRGDTVHDINHCFPALVDVFRDSVGDVAGLIAAVAKSADDSTRRFAARELDNPPRGGCCALAAASGRTGDLGGRRHL